MTTPAIFQGPIFAPGSFWTQPIPASAPLHPNTANFVAEFARQKAAYYNTVGINHKAYCAPIYIAPDGAATQKVTAPSPVYPVLQKQWMDVPIPTYAQAADGSDMEMAIYQPSTDSYWEFWQMQQNPDKTWHARWGGGMSGASKSIGIWSNTLGTTATSLPFAGGQITASELQAGQIKHAIGIALVDCEASGIFSWPAMRSDGLNPGNAPNRIPEGLRFRLDPTVVVDTLPVHPVGKTILRAAQTYGFVVWDKSGAIGMRFLNSKSYTQVGLADPYPALFGSTPDYAIMNGAPWNRLQFLPMNYGLPAA